MGKVFKIKKGEVEALLNGDCYVLALHYEGFIGPACLDGYTIPKDQEDHLEDIVISLDADGVFQKAINALENARTQYLQITPDITVTEIRTGDGLYEYYFMGKRLFTVASPYPVNAFQGLYRVGYFEGLK